MNNASAGWENGADENGGNDVRNEKLHNVG